MTPYRAIEITKLIYCNDCQDEEECEDCIHGLAIEALKKQSIYEQIKWERDVAIEQLESIGIGLGRKMDDVKEALEKQIPKKVVNIDDFTDYAECPSCGAIATDHLGCLYRWCRECGKKLKRSEEE